MTEEEYILVNDLAYLRAAAATLRQTIGIERVGTILGLLGVEIDGVQKKMVVEPK